MTLLTQIENFVAFKQPEASYEYENGEVKIYLPRVSASELILLEAIAEEYNMESEVLPSMDYVDRIMVLIFETEKAII